jgi:hypothetical protein
LKCLPRRTPLPFVLEGRLNLPIVLSNSIFASADTPAPVAGAASFSGTAQSFTVDQATPPTTYLFVNENPNGPNEVRNYRVNADGTTTLVGTYPTGHPGSDDCFVAAERADMARAANYLYGAQPGRPDGVGVLGRPHHR